MTTPTDNADVVLIGGGIMSATLGALLNDLQPDWDIRVYEKLHYVARESSHAWNNAGTGHAALCELNYSPRGANGDIDITKAVTINEQFHQSRQYWSFLVKEGIIADPSTFISPVPHMWSTHAGTRAATTSTIATRRWSGTRSSRTWSTPTTQRSRPNGCRSCSTTADPVRSTVCRRSASARMWTSVR